MIIRYEDLSPGSKQLLGPNMTTYRSEKLSATFRKRVRYVVHYRTLQTYLNLGLKVVQIYDIIQFRQERFSTNFIEMVSFLKLYLLVLILISTFFQFQCSRQRAHFSSSKIRSTTLKNIRNYS